MRSRLYPYREAIAEALGAGTSVRALARTYGVHHTTMWEFIKWHVRRDDEFVARKTASNAKRGSERYATDPAHRLQRCQYNTLYRQREQLDLSRHRTEESYL